MVSKKPKGLGMGLEALLGPKASDTLAAGDGPPTVLALSRLRAGSLGGARGPYALQAAIAACHARAATAQATDWPQIVALYDALSQVAPSPVIELNRAVAVGMAFGPAAGLEIVDALLAQPSLAQALAHYHWLPSVRGDLLAKLGRYGEAQHEFERAAALTRNARERAFLLERALQQGAGSNGAA